MKKIIILILVVAAFACKTSKETSQGVKGGVYWVEGNQMPRIMDDGSGKTAPESKIGVQRTILIHELTHADQVEVVDFLIGEIHSNLVQKISTDENGLYAIRLPPGKYSLFTVESDGYFANTFDEANNLNPVEVKEGEWEVFDIVIDYMAAY